jgi:hypothetical protein
MSKQITENTWLYAVHHINPQNNDMKFIGIYSLKKNAKAAIARLRKKSGFKDSPRKFMVNASQLDRTWWDEGFITWKEAFETSEIRNKKKRKIKRKK